MLLYDIRSFLDHYAPCHVDANTVSQCLENMCRQDEPVIEKDGLGVYRWLLLKRSPSDRATRIGGKNDMAVGPLQNIIDSIQRNSEIPFSSENKLNGRGAMGATLIERFPGEYLSIFGWTYHTDAIVPILAEADDDEHHQILEACRHIMNEDPRRTWIFGLTYKDNVMSVRYFSRAHPVGTHAFDYHQNPADLVELILSFAFASSVQLGIDPLVRMCASYVDEMSPSYVYEIPNAVVGVPSVFYKTCRCLYQERRSSVKGRGTRVWEVTQVYSGDGLEKVNPEQYAILKDVWLDTDARTEVETLDAIFKAVDDFVEAGLTARIEEELKKNSTFDYNPVAMQRLLAEFINMDERFADFDDAVKNRLRVHLTDKNYRSFFLTTLHSWQGQPSQQGGTDAQHYPTVVNESNNKFHAPGSPKSVQAARSASKRQFRFVFDEVCADLGAVGTLGNLMEVVDQALDALRILYCAGWVHRDISKGNLLVFEDASGKWKLKLVDFELSKQSGHGDECIGTPYFMPHEVLRAQYLLNKHRECDEEDSLAVLFNLPVGSPEYERLKDIDKNFCRRVGALPTNATEYIPDYDAAVRYNFQHDLESLWWLVLFYITKCVDHQPSKDYAEFIFQKTLTPSAERSDSFTNSFKLSGKRFLHPTLKEIFKDFMEKLRAAMCEEYVAREAFGQLDTSKSYSYIHNFFAKQLRELLLHHNNSWKDISIACGSGVPEAGFQPPLPATKQGQVRAVAHTRQKKPKRARK